MLPLAENINGRVMEKYRGKLSNKALYSLESEPVAIATFLKETGSGCDEAADEVRSDWLALLVGPALQSVIQP